MSKIEIYKGSKLVGYADMAIETKKSLSYIRYLISSFLTNKREISKEMISYLEGFKIRKVNNADEFKRARMERKNHLARVRRRRERECRLNQWKLSEESRSRKRERTRKGEVNCLGLEKDSKRFYEIEAQLKKKYKKSSLTIPEIIFELGLSGRKVGGIYLTNKLPDMTIESVARYYVKFIEGSEQNV